MIRYISHFPKPKKYRDFWVISPLGGGSNPSDPTTKNQAQFVYLVIWLMLISSQSWVDLLHSFCTLCSLGIINLEIRKKRVPHVSE